MSGAVFMETLRRGWRGMLGWGIGMGLYGSLIVIIIQDADMLKQYGELTKSLPPALLALFGGDAALLATPEGFLGYGYFGYALLILSVYLILNGLNVTASEEEAGILDVVMSLPLPRPRAVGEKLAAYGLLFLGIIVISYMGLLVGLQFSALEIDSGKLLQSTVNIIPAALLILTFTAMSGSLFRSKGMATTVATMFVVISYFVNFIAQAASETVFSALRWVSFFSYYDHNGVILRGLSWGNMALLLVLAGLCTAGAVVFFQRRDIGV